VGRRCRRRAAQQEGYGDLVAGQSFRRFRSVIGVEQGYNLDVPARILLNRGISRFVPAGISKA
jgi:hypothetical protein